MRLQGGGRGLEKGVGLEGEKRTAAPPEGQSDGELGGPVPSVGCRLRCREHVPVALPSFVTEFLFPVCYARARACVCRVAFRVLVGP